MRRTGYYLSFAIVVAAILVTGWEARLTNGPRQSGTRGQ